MELRTRKLRVLTNRLSYSDPEVYCTTTRPNTPEEKPSYLVDTNAELEIKSPLPSPQIQTSLIGTITAACQTCLQSCFPGEVWALCRRRTIAILTLLCALMVSLYLLYQNARPSQE